MNRLKLEYYTTVSIPEPILDIHKVQLLYPIKCPPEFEKKFFLLEIGKTCMISV